MEILPFGGQAEPVETFDWDSSTRKYVAGVLSEFFKAYTLKMEPLDILGFKSTGQARRLQEYWDDSVLAYAALSETLRDPNDPVVPYQTTILRDKADAIISVLASNMLRFDVKAQNPEQAIDRSVSRVSSAILGWQFQNDGWPSESGQQKNVRYITKQVIEGTVHVMDIVTEDGLTSELVPNEEVFIKNFWQPDVQLQPFFVRAKLNLSYEEAEQMFGELENWDYVPRGTWLRDWFGDAPVLKNGFQGLDLDNRAMVLYVWKVASPSELRKLKKQGKVEQSAKRACFYNVIVNGIPMYPADNLSPFRHGFYPISKGKFSEFAKPEFYWGNSLPNKGLEDKKFLDDWKTLLRYKAKLGVLKPMFSIGGSVDDDVFMPSKVTALAEGVQLEPVPGVADGISQSDVSIMQMAEAEIDRGTISPQQAGQGAARAETARATTIAAAAAQRMFDAISLQVAFFQASRAFPILLSSFQFLPKRKIKLIAIPDQTLDDGSTGSLEVVFEDPGRMTEMEMLEKSQELMMLGKKSRDMGEPKDRVYVNPKYLRELKFYVSADPSSILQDRSSMRQQKLERDAQVLMALPDVDKREFAREYLRLNEYPERMLAKEQAQAQMQGGQPGRPQGSRPTPGDQAAQDASMATTGEPMPALPMGA